MLFFPPACGVGATARDLDKSREGAATLAVEVEDAAVGEKISGGLWVGRGMWEDLDQLRRLLDAGAVRPVFQPVVDLAEGKLWGYEVLSRGTGPLESAGALFGAARKYRLLWELEEVCRRVALEALAREGVPSSVRMAFNVSAATFLDPRFFQSFSHKVVRSAGLVPEQIILEITEQEAFCDAEAMGSAVALARDQGFAVAIDDLGAGFAGLMRLLICRPDVIKLDLSLVRGVASDAYQRHLVHALGEFARRVRARVVAEGVETSQDLETLVSLGVCHAQGFFFGAPEATLRPLDPQGAAHSRDAWRRCREEHDALEGIEALALRGETALRGTLRGEDVGRLLSRASHIDHLVFLERERPVGLLTEGGYQRKVAGAFGYHLYARRPAEELAREDFLTARVGTPVTEVAKMAMERPHDVQYDPVVVVDAEGCFRGSVTMRQIISRAEAMELELARGSNPLTGLPGNRQIEGWIAQCQRREGAFALIYADLDRFKEYNDAYGFFLGDRLLAFTSEVLHFAVGLLPPGTRLGHVGGDDFVLVVPGTVDLAVLETVCRHFDREKEPLFRPEDWVRTWYTAKTRTGEVGPVPLVTLSLAVVESARIEGHAHVGQLAEIAAALKGEAKRRNALRGSSGFFCHQRRCASGEPEDAVTCLLQTEGGVVTKLSYTAEAGQAEGSAAPPYFSVRR